jgi:hypothetical protein
VMNSVANLDYLNKLGWVPDYDLDKGLMETIKKEKMLYDQNHII